MVTWFDKSAIVVQWTKDHFSINGAGESSICLGKK